MTRTIRLAGLTLAVIAAFGISACGDDEPAGPGGGGVTLVPAENSGADQLGSPGQTFGEPIRVQVLVDGIPTGGVPVRWTPSDGSVNPPTSDSGQNGIATTTWTLGGAASLKSGDGALSSAGVAKVVSVFATVPDVSEDLNLRISAFSVPAEHAVVEVRNNSFVPVRPGSVTNVARGTSVTWVWVSDAVNHNVSPTNGSKLPIRSGEPRNGPYVYTQLFEEDGVYAYECTVHGSTGMTGTVTVSLAP
jgi:plastocyanin